MNSKKYMQLKDIDAYVWAFNLSNYIWNIVMKWDWFAKKTVGSQFVNAADSISANIAEGYGRYHKKDKIRFYRISQGSHKECYDWNAKSYKRNLLSKEEYEHIYHELKRINPATYRLINYTNEKLKI